MEAVTLKGVLDAFNAPVNESQAWAICYQCGIYLLDLWKQCPEQCHRFNGVSAVYIAKDGNVLKVDAVTDITRAASPGAAKSQYELVQSLGVVVFQALDYGLSEAEEQTISPALEGLLDRMTGAESDSEDRHPASRHDDDEGIENDADDDDARDKITLQDVVQACSCHLQNPKDAPHHYKAVCRALVTEATELSTFLEKISTDRERLKDTRSTEQEETDVTLDDLNRADWARLWIQVMKQLRHGVQLKAVENVALQHTQFTLTPYEMLMEDIRSRRYTLNKVMVDGAIPPRMKKDAHAIILDFIRSRPPLHPAKDRKLPPTPPDISETNLRDQLMRAIRSDHQLRPTPGNIVETSRARLHPDDESPSRLRKVIKADFILNFDSDEDESDEDFEDDLEDRNKVTPSPIGSLTPLSPTTAQETWRKSTSSRHGSLARSPSGHRNSITVCETPTNPSKSLIEVVDDDADEDEEDDAFETVTKKKKVPTATLR